MGRHYEKKLKPHRHLYLLLDEGEPSPPLPLLAGPLGPAPVRAGYRAVWQPRRQCFRFVPDYGAYRAGAVSGNLRSHGHSSNPRGDV